MAIRRGGEADYRDEGCGEVGYHDEGCGYDCDCDCDETQSHGISSVKVHKAARR